MAHPELGSRLLDSVIAQVDGLGKIETQARLEGRNMTMVLAPEKKAVVKKERTPGEPKSDAGDHDPADSTTEESTISESTTPESTIAETIAAEPEATLAESAAPDATESPDDTDAPSD